MPNTFGRTVDGVEKIVLKNSAGKEVLDKGNFSIFERSQKLAYQYRMVFEGLKKRAIAKCRHLSFWMLWTLCQGSLA